MLFKTRNHVNIVNLLVKYEERFKDESKQDWRLKAYLDSVFEMLDEEEKLFGQLNDELLAAKKKAEFFRNLLEARTRASSLSDKYAAINACHLVPNESRDGEPNRIDENIHQTTKEIVKNQKLKCEAEIRRELFAKNREDEDRMSKQMPHVEKSYEDIVRYHNVLQEQVTNEMVKLAQNLKSNITISNEIVKKDTELLESTNKFADGTVNSLKTNTTRIAQFANAACEYWLWICLFLVTITFFSMVIFIRLFPKRHVHYVLSTPPPSIQPSTTITPSEASTSMFNFGRFVRTEL